MSRISDINSRAWDSFLAAYSYRKRTSLYPSEERVFDFIGAERFANSSLIDIGMGAGRTTRHLLGRTLNYAGMDYSQAMIRQARREFPNVPLHCMDARDMKAFPDEHFDIALFSYNGLDYSSHGDRTLILKEIHRILKPRGLFVFSTHNRDYEKFEVAISRPKPSFDGDTKNRMVESASALYRNFRAKRIKLHSVFEEDYCQVVDGGLFNSLLTYYIEYSTQKRQLEDLDFRTLATFGDDGTPLSDTSDKARYSYIYYLAERC